MSALDTVNRLSCPEFTGHTTRHGITSYAVRWPGEADWQGIALKEIDGAMTPSRYTSPVDAITAAVERLQTTR